MIPGENWKLSGDLAEGRLSELRISGEGEETAVYGFESMSDELAVSVFSEKDRDVFLTVFTGCSDLYGGVVSSLQMECAGQTFEAELFASENEQPLYFPLHLEAGENTAVFRTGMGGSTLWISRIEIRDPDGE